MSDPTILRQQEIAAREQSLESRAREMGWTSQDEFRGAPERWIDAEQYLRRGEEMLPIVKATNRRLEAKAAALEAKVQQLVQAVADGQDSMAAMKEYQAEEVKRHVAVARARLVDEIKLARRDGDIDAEVEAQTALGRLSDVPAEPKKEAPKQSQPQQVHPDFPGWQADNDWFGPSGDPKATAYALAIGEFVKLSPDTKHLTGRQFMDKVTELTAEKFPQLFPARFEDSSTVRGSPSKVESSRIGSSRPSGRTYADLPADVKATCDRQGTRLIGPTRNFKTEAEWRTHYVNMYFEDGLYV